MVIEHTEAQHHIAGSSDRAFGFVMAAAFAVIASWPLVRGGEMRAWALAVAGAFLAFAVAWPAALAVPNRLWMRLGLLLNRIVSPIALGLVFFLAILPTGLAMRALGKDPLRLRPRAGAATYWIAREPPGPEPRTMDQQF
jgi:saxitoxin biosynthesis operon SxtJ-like protein